MRFPLRWRLHARSCCANLLHDGLRTYEFDAANRLANATLGTGVAAPTTRYVHNALGQRLFKTEPLFPPVASGANPADPAIALILTNFSAALWGGNTTTAAPSNAEKLGFQYYYDEEGSLLAEIGAGGANSAGSTQYIYLPTPSGPMPIAALVNTTHYAVHTDHLNTPRRLTLSNKTVAWQWALSAFGDEQPTTAKNRFVDLTTSSSLGTTNVSDVTFNLRYPGQYFDKESGLHYNYFRSYDAKTGRYTQADPIDLAGGWNKFGYVDGNPLMYTDPYGLFEWQTIPQPAIDFATGVADAASLGLGPLAREALGVDGGVDECSGAYSAGQWSSLALGGGRVLYAGVAKAGATAAASGAAAMEFRNGLKRVMRGPLAGSDFRIKNYAELLAKYGSDGAIKAAAGRTNAGVNAVGGNLTIGSTVGRTTCGCPR